MMIYAVGLLDELGWGKFDEVSIEPLGLQWTAEPWVVSVEDLKTFKQDVMLPAFIEAYSINPKATAGDHCIYCSAKIHCKEWQKKFKGLDNEYFKNNDIAEADNDKLVEMFKLTKQADNLKKNYLSIELMQRAEGFNPPKGLSLVKGRKLEKWKDEKKAKKKLGKKFYEKTPRKLSSFKPDDKKGLITTTYARGHLK